MKSLSTAGRKRAAPSPAAAPQATPLAFSIASLHQAGAFTGRPVEKEISWRQGGQEYSATVFVRPLGFQSAVSDVLAAGGREDGAADALRDAFRRAVVGMPR